MGLKILCKIGFHKWEKAGGYTHFSSNVKEKRYICARCGKRKNKIITK